MGIYYEDFYHLVRPLHDVSKILNNSTDSKSC